MKQWLIVAVVLGAMVLAACSRFDRGEQADSVYDFSQETNPEALAAAAAGDLGQPALVFFHADWCTVCQRIKPDVQQLQEQYDGNVAVIRMNVDASESRRYLTEYDVRGAPTFILFDDDGTRLATVPGWPGKDRFVQAFDQVLATQ